MMCLKRIKKEYQKEIGPVCCLLIQAVTSTMLSVDIVRNHVTGIRVIRNSIRVPMCSESGSLPVTESMYMIY